jgi:uncharacterized membrane protein SpoIIM required for sporulation
MISNLWIDLRKDNWNRLDVLLRQVEAHGVKSLPYADLRDFGLLYRQAAADLSAVRSDRSSRSLETYLNRLVGRAHNYVYSGERISTASLWRFLAYGYPRLLRRLSFYVLLATSITVFAAALGTLITLVRPEYGVAFFTTHLGPDAIANLDKHKMWTESILSVKPEMSSAIMTNNITVCFMTFAGGITAGLFTVFELLNNGFMLGVTGVVCARHHMSLSLWSFIAAHGALELPAIMLAGAAGLRLGAGILFPGLLRRRDSVAVAGVEAVQFVSATIPLLIIAGTLEAFLSPTHVPVALKFAVGAALFTGLCLWLTAGGRKTVSSEQEAASSTPL